MFKNTLAAAAVLGTIGTAALPPQAHATWYLASVSCMPLKTFEQRHDVPATLIVHTPDQLVALMNSVNGDEPVTDVSATFAAKFPDTWNRSTMRMLNFGGPHGYNFMSSDLATCRLMADSIATTGNSFPR